MVRRGHIATVIVVLVSSSADARADSIPAPTQSCPRGGVPESSHQGQWCDARVCKSDADCNYVWGPKGPTQGKCESTSLCVRTEHVRKFDTGLAPDGATYTFEKRTALRECTSGFKCEDGSPCATEMRCIAPSAKPAAPVMPEGSARGCGCGKTTGPKASSVVGLLAALWLVRRRR